MSQQDDPYELICYRNSGFVEHKIGKTHTHHMRRTDGHVVTDSPRTVEIRVRFVAVFGSVNSEHGSFCPVRCQYASICE